MPRRPWRTAVFFTPGTRGTMRYELPAYRSGDAFLMGPETHGLPEAMLDALPPKRNRPR